MHQNHYDLLDRWGTPPDQSNKQRISQTIALIPEDVATVLDIGCGDGMISAPLIQNQYDVTGIDISKVALKYYKGKSSIASSADLPFQTNQFDLSICAEVLEHLPKPIYKSALDEIMRVTRKHIVISTPNNEYLPAGFTKCNYCGCTFHVNYHVRAFTQKEHTKLFNDFDHVKTIKINHWRHVPLQYWIQQHILHVYSSKPGVLCLCCQNIITPQTALLIGLAAKGVTATAKLIPGYSKARWLASLYKKRNLSTSMP